MRARTASNHLLGRFESRITNLRRLAVAAEEKVAYQRNAHVEGHHQDIRDQIRAFLDAIVKDVCFAFLGADDRGDIFQEIHAALFARPAMPLLVLARRTFVAQRHMASRAEPRDVARFAAAFRALHRLILRATGRGGGRACGACAHPVNTGRAVRRGEAEFEHAASVMWSAGACSRFCFDGACPGGFARLMFAATLAVAGWLLSGGLQAGAFLGFELGEMRPPEGGRYEGVLSKPRCGLSSARHFRCGAVQHEAHGCSTSEQARTADSGGKPPHSTWRLLLFSPGVNLR